MDAESELLVLSPTLSLVRLSDTWILEDPYIGSHRTLNQLPTWLRELLAAGVICRPGTREDWERRAQSCGVPADQAPRCVDSLQRARILVSIESSRCDRDSAPLRDFQWTTCSTLANYADPRTPAADVEQMFEFAQASVPPAPYHSLPAAERIWLPHPYLDPAWHPMSDVARIVFLTNGVLQGVAIGPLPRTRRVPPSHGASHPFDLVLSLGAPWLSAPRTFYYDPDEHCLIDLTGLPDAGRHAGLLADALEGIVAVAVHLEVRRAQWRYRTSTAYPTLFLDLGHLVETLTHVANDMGWTVTHVPLGSQPSLKSPNHVFGPILELYQLRPTGGRTHEQPTRQ